MSYTRATAATYLDSEFGELRADAGIASGEAGWKTVLDKVFRVTTAVDEEDQEALLDLFALERLAKALAPRVGITKTTAGTTAQKSRNQAFTHVDTMLKAAREKAKELGLVGGSTWEYGTIDLDFIEPSGVA